MIQVFLLSFREYLEAFLLIIGFLLLARHFQINKLKEIFTGAISAFLLSFALTVLVYALGSNLSAYLKEAQIDHLEGWLLLSSAILVALFAFPLHSFIWKKIEKRMPQINARIQGQNPRFDLLLFSLVFLLVFKEGMEALLFTAGVSLINDFLFNTIGLFLGFFMAGSLALVFHNSLVLFKAERFFTMIALFVLLGAATLFQQSLVLLTAWPYVVTDLLAGVYGAVIYAIFLKGKSFSNN